MGVDTRRLLSDGEHFHGFVVKRCLGEGGVASVYLVRHEVLDSLYAIKVLAPSVADTDPFLVKRFMREARLATRLKHENLVTVHDCGYDVDKDLYYLVMDYVPGTSLRVVIAFEGRLSVERSADIVLQVSSALHSAQSFNLVHRDIKPENIIIGEDGRVKLLDLGIAKATNLGDSLHTTMSSVLGTPAYLSPEQAVSSANVDVRADVYSLGIVFFEMLTGKCPYDGENLSAIMDMVLSSDEIPDPREFVHDIPEELSAFVRRMVAKDRSKRIASFDVVVSELHRMGFGERNGTAWAAPCPEAESPGMRTLLHSIPGVTGVGAGPNAKQDEGGSGLSRKCIVAVFSAIAALLAIALWLVLWLYRWR